MPRLTKAYVWMAGLALLLAACAPPAPERITSFKRQGAEIYSAAAFVPARIAGDWRQVAGYTRADRPGCGPGVVQLREAGAGLSIRGQLCLDGRMQPVSGLMTSTGPGRLSVPGMQDWWVIWVDSGYRTLAVATPSGAFGFVLDRGAIPGDRLKAAAEIFDFNGYSRAGLRPF